MRNVILQLFLNKYKIRDEIEKLQSSIETSGTKAQQDLIHAKHEEWDRTNHLIDLFFQSINL